MQRIDAHLHFWNFDLRRDVWITDDMKILQEDFLPQDLLHVLKENNIHGCVAVQASQSETETNFLLQLSEQYEWIRAVVGWVDLRAGNIEERLEYYSSFKKIKGFRHIVQSEPQDDFLLRDDFCKGISLLRKFGFTYDILVYPKHLRYVLEFVKQFPEQLFVIDHLAKPSIKNMNAYGKLDEFEKWRKDMYEVSTCNNVYCKLSGMAVEADWKNWRVADFKPYIDTVMDAFGRDRIMFGSDWPVSLLAASYEQSCGLVEQNTAHLNNEVKAKLWGGNAIAFYNL